MTICYNSDPSYAWTRLQGSYVRRKGSDLPIYIRGMDGTEVEYHELMGGRNKFCELNELNLEPIPLGNMNYNDGAYYVMRVPSRSWRQGLRTSNITGLKEGRFRNVQIEGNRAFYNMTLNKYPTIQECFEDIYNDEAKSKAFTKNFSLGKNNRSVYSLFHKDVKVGTVQDLDGAFDPIFGKKYEWLAEKFGDEINA